MIPVLLAAATAQGAANAHAAQLAGIRLGSQVSGVIRARGNPDVLTTDIGHIWSWRKGGSLLRITTDDDGTIRLIDTSPASVHTSPTAQFVAPGTLPGTSIPVLFSAYAQGANILLVVAREGGRTIREAFLGYRDELAKAGFIPGASGEDAFHAAVLEKMGAADYNSPSEGTAYVRIAVGADGSVSAATIYFSSGDAVLDRAAVASALHDSFRPATLNGKPVASVYFHRQDFVHTSP